MKNSILFTISFVLLSFLFKVNNTFAQTVSGRIVYTTIDETRPELKSINGATFRNAVTKARLETDNPNSPFNGATGVTESWIVPTGNGNYFIHGFGVFADKDGDTFITYFTSTKKEENHTIYIKGGTGKFQNLDGEGTSTKAVQADTGIKEDCCMSNWELTYKM